MTALRITFGARMDDEGVHLSMNREEFAHITWTPDAYRILLLTAVYYAWRFQG